MRVVHYINQFFGGIGSEDKAGAPVEVRRGPVGPGRVLEQCLGDAGTVVATIVCGDNHAAENLDAVARQVVAVVKSTEAELFIAGPCFGAGRYGVASGAFTAAVHTELGIPTVTGMARDNPGVALYRARTYIIDSGASAARMTEVLRRMVSFGVGLVNRVPPGRPSEDGYIARGLLRTEVVPDTAGERLVAMLIAKTTGKPWESELPVEPLVPPPAPPPIRDLTTAKLALVTDGGLVPVGNPDGFERTFCKVWGAYGIAGKAELLPGEYDVAHNGYDNRVVRDDPHRLVPLDVLRELEQRGLIGELHEELLSTTGNGNPLDNSRRIGREMAQRLKTARVDGVVLTST
jgi:glycine reductase